MLRTLKDYLHDESGATGIEYALIGALIAVMISAGLMNVGESLSGKGRTHKCLNGVLGDVPTDKALGCERPQPVEGLRHVGDTEPKELSDNQGL